MMKRLLSILAVTAMLCLSAGCQKPTPPTLTPTFERMQVNLEIHNVWKDGTVYTDTGRILIGEDPKTMKVEDHRGEEIYLTLESTDPDTQTAVIRTSKPLMLDGQETSAITVGREKVRAYAYGEDGEGDELVLWMEPYRFRSAYFTDLSAAETVTMCYGDGMLLTLYTNSFTTKPRFELTFADDLSRKVDGTYVLEEDVLTLQEAAGLSVTTLRRDDRVKGWRVDADASAYHPQAQMPVLADKTVLSFGFAYEVSDNLHGDFEYRVTDFDGNTLLSEKNEDDSVYIRPLSPTMLKLRFTSPGVDAFTHYLNTATGEYSTSYIDVVADSATHTVYVKNDKLIVQELGGEYTQYVLPFVAEDVACAALEGDTATVFYRDEQQAFQVACWNYKTSQYVTADPLAIAGYSSHGDSDSFVLIEDGTSFMPIPAIRQIGTLQDTTLLYLSGVEHAAIRIGEQYVELTEQDWVLSGTKFDYMDYVNPPISSEELLTQLKADAAAGLATAEVCLDGKATVYRYNGEDRFHAVTVADTVRGRCVYIGDAETALADAAIGLEFVK